MSRSLTGAWIEAMNTSFNPKPLPKCVALFTGAWIEIHTITDITCSYNVALFTGAGIENGTIDMAWGVIIYADIF